MVKSSSSLDRRDAQEAQNTTQAQTIHIDARVDSTFVALVTFSSNSCISKPV